MKSIKVRLLVFGIAASIVPLMLLGIYSMKAARSDLENSINKTQAMLAVRVANDTATLVQTLRTSLETMAMAESGRLLTAPASIREQLLYIIINRYPYIEDLAVVDRSGQELTRVSRRYAVGPHDLKFVAGWPYFNDVLRGKPYVGSARLEPDNQVVFTVAVPLTGDSGQGSQGGLIAQVSLRNVMERISSLPVGGGYIFLVDETGHLIGHEDFGQVVRSQDVRASRAVQELMNGEGSGDVPVPSRYVSYTGQEVLGVYTRVAGTGWGVVIEQPAVTIYEPLWDLILKMAAAMMAVIIATVAISVCFALIFTKSLDALAEGVRRVTKGDLQYVIPRQGDDEFGQVVDAFNSMTAELRRRRDLETALNQTEKMSAVGMLAAGVAHEINNPLNTLSFYTTDLLDRLPSEGAAKLEASGDIAYYLKTMQKQIIRCTSITQSLLNFARPHSLEAGETNITQVINDILPLFRHRIRKQQIELALHFPEDLPPLTTSASELQQVLLNLITNALDAMPQGGILTVTAEADRSEKLIRLLVADTGHGMPAYVLSNLFNPFFTTKPAGQGTGLGLSICYGIISRRGGRIVAESSVDKGTCMTVELPL